MQNEYKINKDYKLENQTGDFFKPSHHIGNIITPTIIVLHDTAGRLNFINSASYLRNNQAKTSIHFIVGRDGELEQQVPTNRKANHAGRSSYHGKKWVNNFSIGIEIVNPGKMSLEAPNKAVTWYSKSFDVEEYGIVQRSTDVHGTGMWMPYTEDQLDTVYAILEACICKHNTIKEIVPHWYVSPGRKIDTNPLFPVKHFQDRLFRGVETEEESSFELNRALLDQVKITTVRSRLNLRREPYIHPNVIDSIPSGEVVTLLSTGMFNGIEWNKVLYNNKEGWVVASYTHMTCQQKGVDDA